MVYNGFQIYNSSDVFLPAAQSDDLDQTIDYNEVQSKSKVYTVRANSIEKSRPSAIKAIKA
jgi:dihydroneopterin aldolase